MRDYRRIVAALERKAASSACTAAEASALRAKAAELRDRHELVDAGRPAGIGWVAVAANVTTNSVAGTAWVTRTW